MECFDWFRETVETELSVSLFQKFPVESAWKFNDKTKALKDLSEFLQKRVGVRSGIKRRSRAVLGAVLGALLSKVFSSRLWCRFLLRRWQEKPTSKVSVGKLTFSCYSYVIRDDGIHLILSLKEEYSDRKGSILTDASFRRILRETWKSLGAQVDRSFGNLQETFQTRLR